MRLAAEVVYMVAQQAQEDLLLLEVVVLQIVLLEALELQILVVAEDLVDMDQIMAMAAMAVQVL
jgi:hypothetical protein